MVRTRRRTAAAGNGGDRSCMLQNRREALAADGFGSRVSVFDGEVFRGQARIEWLAAALKSGSAPSRSQV
jgi:2-hydroxychromene-2-carboxylate isomerase